MIERGQTMWLFRREDPELRALRRQLKEAEERTKQARIESEARIRQVQEESRQRLAELDAQSRVQREDFIRQLEELAREHSLTTEQLAERVRAQMQASLDRLSGGPRLSSDEQPFSARE